MPELPCPCASCCGHHCGLLCHLVIPAALWNPSAQSHAEGEWTWNPFCGAVLRDPAQLLLWKWTKSNVLCCAQADLARVIAAGWHVGYDEPLSVWAAVPHWIWGLAVNHQIEGPGNKAKATHEVFFIFFGCSDGTLYGNLTTVSCWLTVTRALCLSPYFYLWAYFLFAISCCVTEYFS